MNAQVTTEIRELTSEETEAATGAWMAAPFAPVVAGTLLVAMVGFLADKGSPDAPRWWE